MVTRGWLACALVALCFGCQGPAAEGEAESLVLRGFQRVDIESQEVTTGDIVIEHGVVVEHPTLSRQRVVDGHGAFVMPALWDLKASLWGNDSAHNWDELTQEMNFSRCLRVHLYFGVAHVGAFAMGGDWVDRELRRADALELSAAESLYPAKTLCSIENFGCDPVKTPADAARALDVRQQRRAPFIYVSYVGAPKSPMPGLSRELLAASLSGAAARHLPAFVLINDWERARVAVELGASVISGLPSDQPPSELVQLMRERHVAYAPALTAFLELDRLLGHAWYLREPWLQATVRPEVLRTFRHEQELWSEFRPDLVFARQHRMDMLAGVKRMDDGGVRILAASDAGWAPGTFQGYSSHALQTWLEGANLDAWTRLAAATVWPAELVGRHVGFNPGDPADFVTFAKSPLERADNSQSLELVIRRGQIVDRPTLLPDVTRGGFPQ